MLGVKKDYCLACWSLIIKDWQAVHITHLIVVERLYLIIYAKINFASNLRASLFFFLKYAS